MKRAGFLLALVFSAAGGAALARDWALAPGADLGEALRVAAPGDRLLLAPGDYPAVALRGVQGQAGAPIVVRAAVPDDPPRLLGFQGEGLAHLTFERLIFDYRFAPGDPEHHAPFAFIGGGDLVIRQSWFDGDSAAGLGPGVDGLPYATGLSLRGVKGARVERNLFRLFQRGLMLRESEDLVLRGNEVTEMRSEGINGAALRRVEITGNYIHDFRRDESNGDHADMIQFWTAGTDRPSEDIVISGNWLEAGAGLYTQSIFLRNERVDQGEAGRAMFYRNLVIEGNVILNAHRHGIVVGETQGLRIARNSLWHVKRAEGARHDPGLTAPRITVSAAAEQVEITGNIAAEILGPEGQADWQVAGNAEVQDETRLRSGFYDLVLVPAPPGGRRGAADFRPLPGGPLDRSGLGSDLREGGADAGPD